MKIVIKEFMYLMCLVGFAFLLSVVSVSLLIVGWESLHYLVLVSSVNVATSTIDWVMGGIILFVVFNALCMWSQIRNMVDSAFGLSKYQRTISESSEKKKDEANVR